MQLNCRRLIVCMCACICASVHMCVYAFEHVSLSEINTTVPYASLVYNDFVFTLLSHVFFYLYPLSRYTYIDTYVHVSYCRNNSVSSLRYSVWVFHPTKFTFNLANGKYGNRLYLLYYFHTTGDKIKRRKHNGDTDCYFCNNWSWLV